MGEKQNSLYFHLNTAANLPTTAPKNYYRSDNHISAILLL